MTPGVKETFTEIYRTIAWGGRRGEYYSGYGSEDVISREYVQFVRNFIRANDIGSLVDLGCGDFRVGRHLQMPRMSYLGVGVVEGLIEFNLKNHSDDDTSFTCLDITRRDLPPGETIRTTLWLPQKA